MLIRLKMLAVWLLAALILSVYAKRPAEVCIRCSLPGQPAIKVPGASSAPLIPRSRDTGRLSSITHSGPPTTRLHDAQSVSQSGLRNIGKRKLGALLGREEANLRTLVVLADPQDAFDLLGNERHMANQRD
jgi:hypothetical protein